jgi:hydrogenase-4 component F
MPMEITRVIEATPQLTSLALLIILAPLAAALGSLFLRRHPKINGWLTTISSIASLLAVVFAVSWVGDQGHIIRLFPFFNLYLDSLSVYFVLLVNLVALFASFSIPSFLSVDARQNKFHNPAYFYAFFNLFHMTMVLVPMVDNLVVLWISVELTTVFSTILVRYRRDRLSLEAAWKFIMITTTGIIFALMGTLFLANALPESVLRSPESADLMGWSYLANASIATQLDPSFVKLSFLFILLGYGTKAGLAPMHTWLPDGHGQAPAPVSALLSGVMLKSALYAILRFYTITNLCLGDKLFTSRLLLLTGVFSLALATPFILKRNKFKRILAYHSLEHMGIITFGIGIGTPIALFGALLHALNHALTKALMFLVYGSLQYEYQERCGIDATEGEPNIQGVLKVLPFSGTILAFGGLALVGSPPFSIFMSEFIILWAAIQQAHDRRMWLGVALFFFIVTITCIFGGLVGHLARLLLGPAPFEPVKYTFRRVWMLAPFIVLVLILFLFGVMVPAWPVDFPHVLQNSVRVVLSGVEMNLTNTPLP